MTRSRARKDSSAIFHAGASAPRKFDDSFKSYLRAGPDRRQYRRQASYIIASYSVLEGTFQDIIKDIGAGGLSVRTDRHIAAGQPITIKFPLWQFDSLIEIRGRVVYQSSNGFDVVFDEPIHGLICRDGFLPEIVDRAKRST